MAMNLETRHPQAFDLLRKAQASLDEFKRRKEQDKLVQANQFISEALTIDPQYLRAFYYRGMVNDLRGQAEEAVDDFELVLRQNPPFLPEVKYNLGVACFNRYGSPNLVTAIAHFKDVIQSTENPALRLLARAGIAHAYAVLMIPGPDSKIESCEAVENYLKSEQIREHVAKYHRLSVESSSQLARELEKQKGLSEAITNEIKWRLCNTRAVQRMFYTDYFDDGRIEKLEEAKAALIEADGYSPDNWSVYCNLGSTFMRLGYWLSAEAKGPEDKKKAKEYFDAAIARLDKVITDLLPEYGFALYETGRVYRLRGDFDRAKTFFDRAKKVRKNRAVSDRTLRCERELAENSHTDYPFLRATASSK